MPHPGVALLVSGVGSAAHGRQARLAAQSQMLARAGWTRGARLVSLEEDEEDPDEAELRKEMGRGWVVRSMENPGQGSGVGGGGMPRAPVEGALDAEALKKQQFRNFVRHRGFAKEFHDKVIDARTGQPLNMSESDIRWMKIADMREEAKEQEDMDGIASLFSDAHIPSQYIYPDGEAVVPKEVKIKFKGMQDKHVGADGKTSYHSGPMWGVFREDAIGEGVNASHGRFGKFGEGLGFRDRPLPVRDVDYEDIRDKQLEAMQKESDKVEARREAYVKHMNGTGTLYCSGKNCDEVWGNAGVGDEVIDLDTGEAVYKGVGPGGESLSASATASGEDESWELDRHVDPHTGAEFKHCVGPQCKGWEMPELPKWASVKDERVPATQGHAVFGRGIPSDPTADPQEIREYQKAGWDGDGGGVDDETDTLRREAAEDEYGEYNSDPTARHWTTGHHAGPGLIKDWNVGSWIGFIVLGPVLTSGVSLFVFMTRGPMWGLIVLSGMATLDGVLFYVG